MAPAPTTRFDLTVARFDSATTELRPGVNYKCGTRHRLETEPVALLSVGDPYPGSPSPRTCGSDVGKIHRLTAVADRFHRMTQYSLPDHLVLRSPQI